GKQPFGVMPGSIVSNQRHRIADPVDEAGQTVPPHADLRGPDDRGLPVPGARQVRRTDRQAEPVATGGAQIGHRTPRRSGTNTTANDRTANVATANPVPLPSRNADSRGNRLGDATLLGDQPSGARRARSIDSISERDSAPRRRLIRATWCSTVLAEM